MGAKLLLELASGVTELPPLGAEDSVAAGRINQYLGRRPLWVGLRDQVRASGQGRLSSYSLTAWVCLSVGDGLRVARQGGGGIDGP